MARHPGRGGDLRRLHHPHPGQGGLVDGNRPLPGGDPLQGGAGRAKL